MLTLVKTLMTLRGINQVDLSIKSGVSPTALSRYLSGSSDLRSENLLKLMKALGSDFNEIVKKEISKSLGNDDLSNISEDIQKVLLSLDSISKKTLIETIISQGKASRSPEVKTAVGRLKKYRDGIRTVRRVS